MSNAASDLTWVMFYVFTCVLTSSASSSPTEKLTKFTTRATSDEEELGRSLSSANEEVSSRSDSRRAPLVPLSTSKEWHFNKGLLHLRSSEASGRSSRQSPSRRSSASDVTTQAGGVVTKTPLKAAPLDRLMSHFCFSGSPFCGSGVSERRGGGGGEE